MKEKIRKIKDSIDIIKVASQYTNLKKKEKSYWGLCPFHIEKTPSFTVDKERQLYHCFGCGAGGDVFTLVMEKENMTFEESVEYLYENIERFLKEEGEKNE
ncbi:MAG: CHC2 zinc finger domain-containing protein [Candidatus Aminicenantaceae bacterium]